LEHTNYKDHYTIVETYIHMNMARNECKYGKEGKIVFMFKYTYAGIR